MAQLPRAFLHKKGTIARFTMGKYNSCPWAFLYNQNKRGLS